MIRNLLGFQLLAFLIYGVISGITFSVVLEYKIHQAETQAISAFIITQSPSALTEIKI